MAEEPTPNETNDDIPDPASVPGTDENREALRKAADDAASGVSNEPDPSGLPDPGTLNQRPEGVPEKFWDAEKGEVRTDALIKSYTELEKTRNGSVKPDDLTLERNEPEAPEISDDDDFQKIAERAGLSESDITEQFSKEGSLTDDQYAALRKVGIPKALANQGLSAMTAAAAASRDKVQEQATTIAGGEEQLMNLREWGSQNLSEADQAWYGEQVSDARTAIKAVEWLHAKHREAVGAGQASPLIGGTSEPTAASVSTRAFESNAELTAAMQDPRYAPTLPDGSHNPSHDPAFRKQALSRLNATKDARSLR